MIVDTTVEIPPRAGTVIVSSTIEVIVRTLPGPSDVTVTIAVPTVEVTVSPGPI